jgi:mono/diheme cytochrome c family protein
MARLMATRLAALAAVVAAVGLITACSTTGDEGTTSTTEEVANQPSETTETGSPEQPLSPAQEHGQELFVANCGSCHTLEAAGTQGQVGPNLDEAQVDRNQVLAAIDNGGLGSGTMPPDLVTGKDAQDVASFVAGEEPAGN